MEIWERFVVTNSFTSLIVWCSESWLNLTPIHHPKVPITRSLSYQYESHYLVLLSSVQLLQRFQLLDQSFVLVFQDSHPENEVSHDQIQYDYHPTCSPDTYSFFLFLHSLSSLNGGRTYLQIMPNTEDKVLIWVEFPTCTVVELTSDSVGVEVAMAKLG